MIKIFLLTLAAAFSAPVKMPAKSDLNLQCITSMPTSSFYLRTEDQDVVLKVVHHNGTDYMPIHEGVVVPHDFPFLKDRASLLMPLGDQVEFKFPRKKCVTYGTGLIRCSGGERKTVNGVDMEALSFYTSKTREETLGMVIEGWKMNLDLNAMGHPPVLQMTMNYAPEECRFSF